ncbi:MAG TPA: hypothetical protein VFQ40_02770 [Actinomycetota bacterium]|nr:hypothetical protein [Actinomycetota bacterium]
MPEVTCPQCRTRQPVEPDAETYRCLVCAASWNFVRCTVCGERYHTRPGTRAWTCPNCGTPHGRNRRGISRRGAPIPLVIGAVILVGGIVALAQALGGDDVAPPPTRSPTPAPIEDPAGEVCRDLVDVQLLRVAALGRAADDLTADAEALRAEGAERRAMAVHELVTAIVSYQEVAEGGGDTEAATNALLDALAAVDWC